MANDTLPAGFSSRKQIIFRSDSSTLKGLFRTDIQNFLNTSSGSGVEKAGHTDHPLLPV
jgi:hypothetical protein